MKELARKRKPKEPNWEKIQTEYVTTDISQRKLAEKYKVPYNTLKRNSAVGGWVKLRAEHKRKVTAKAADAIAGAQAQDLADLIKAAAEATKSLLKVYEDEEQFHRHLVEIRDADGGQDVEERVYKKADTKAMRDCVVMLKELTAVCRDLYELPAKAKEENSTDNKVEVVFEGADVEAWCG